jgi:hypothetical protein
MGIQNRMYQDVYYVETESEDFVMDPLAICPHIKANGYVEWCTTSPSLWGVALKVNIVKIIPELLVEGQMPDVIVLETRDYKRITLRRVTMELYNEHIRHQLAGRPAFDSLEVLKKYFLETNFQAY